MIMVVSISLIIVIFFFFNDTATTEIYTLSLHDALPIWPARHRLSPAAAPHLDPLPLARSEEHTSELQSRENLVCRLQLEKKKKNKKRMDVGQADAAHPDESLALRRA